MAIEVIKTLTRMGMKLAGAKLTGVAAMRDIFKMQDYGVYNSVSFVDAGISSTANIPDEDIKDVVRGALDYLSEDEPDAIMIEFGDGLMGRYGVNAVLHMKEIQENVRLHIGCASDPVGAIGLARECKRIGIPIDVISGPVTDNQTQLHALMERPAVLTRRPTGYPLYLLLGGLCLPVLGQYEGMPLSLITAGVCIAGSGISPRSRYRWAIWWSKIRSLVWWAERGV